MSQKWRRSQKWDDEHIPGWAWPARWLLRAFSSITLAVVLLSLVVVYATLASVPIGMLALIPTYVLYGASVAITVAAVAGLPAVGLRVLLRARGRAVRFTVPLVAFGALAVAGAWLWHQAIWPSLRYDPIGGEGVRLFADFAERYRSTTLRRLPGLEMSELEFYSWWPLRVVLLAFVLNMVVATVRRIEFTFPNIGVLTVHTGIVVMAVGSVYYKALKQEGDTILLAGHPGPDGVPVIGPAQGGFYDNTEVSLWVDRGANWEQRPLPTGPGGVPRYNDYNLWAGGEASALVAIGRDLGYDDGGRTLDVPVPPSRNGPPDGFAMRVVGYAMYTDSSRPFVDWVRADPSAIEVVRPGQRLNPLRFLDLVATFPDDAAGENSRHRFFFLPDQPAHRVSEVAGAFSIEWTRGMDEGRWRALTEPLPPGATHALVVEVPDAAGGPPFRAVYPAAPGGTIAVGGTGYTLSVQEVLPRPPFNIITEGYEGATSAVAIVTVTTPRGETYDRYIYHRFPEISQDLLRQTNERGMPTRRDADPAIRVWHVDASRVNVYLDEREDGTVRAVVRLPPTSASEPAEIRVTEGLPPDGVLGEFVPRRSRETDPRLDLALGERWEHAERLERPRLVPEAERDNQAVGTHQRAMLAVEVSVPREGADGSARPWRRVVWLPFVQYMETVGQPGPGTPDKTVTLPDGRQIRLVFGRRRHALPGFTLQLVDFEMIAYDHRGAPRDYQSTVAVKPTGQRFIRFAFLPRTVWEWLPESWRFATVDFEPYQHVTKLNAPLQAPFMVSEERGWLANTAGLLASRLNPRQFKFSQAGWDAEGWQQTQALADRGEMPRPVARFTILGVGNNPGIHVIALGAILVAAGIPWAFYIKPLIMRARKRKIQQQLAAGAYRPPARAEPATVGR